MNKNSSINEELDSLYTKLETTLLKEQPNPIIALAAVEILKDDIYINILYLPVPLGHR